MLVTNIATMYMTKGWRPNVFPERIESFTTPVQSIVKLAKQAPPSTRFLYECQMEMGRTPWTLFLIICNSITVCYISPTYTMLLTLHFLKKSIKEKGSGTDILEALYGLAVRFRLSNMDITSTHPEGRRRRNWSRISCPNIPPRSFTNSSSTPRSK